ncbi:MAG: GspE/PulE family protein [Candidatus Moranbacteria bacterium]|nr:GspE/PulE family protein [Candidatus Moranbacteria bacterium]
MVYVVHKDDASSDANAEYTSKVLDALRSRSIEEETALAAEKHGLRYLDLGIYPVDEKIVFLLTKEQAMSYGAALFQKDKGKLRIALSEPENVAARTALTTIATDLGLEPEFFLVSRPSIEKAWHEYDKKPLIENLDFMHVTLKGDDLQKFESDFSELLEIKHNASKIPTSRILEIIIAGAYKLRSSDIHFEPFEDTVRLRYRIDGELQEIGQLPNEIYRLALSRVKMISKMKINIRDRSQDGHFFVELEKKRIDVRVNIIPGNHGESINMRLLTGEEAFVPVEELGLRGRAYDEVKRQTERPFGMILNTGPTGSGKTTTLYSLLNSVNSPHLKIITIEDPIEYVLPGIVQTEVSKDKSYTFAQGLRAIVRQDPDIILVGEIRDEETADIALNAALTGHLVFSTLHTNSAAASIARLMELGAKTSSIVTGVSIFIAQRLVRILCPKCKASYVPAQKTVTALKKILSYISPKAGVVIPDDIPLLYKPAGCNDCNFTGYRGRKGIFEVFPVNEKMGALISSGALENEIRAAAIEDGMLTMSQDGILKVIDGNTTMDEVWDSAGKEEALQSLYDDILSDSNVKETIAKGGTQEEV